MISIADGYLGFNDLLKVQTEGTDFIIKTKFQQSSKVAVIAPHGGKIEGLTSDISTAVAAEDFNLYLFEGIRSTENYSNLHLTSHKFDEPRCLHLISRCQHVIAFHGCNGDVPQIFLGGLDYDLKQKISDALTEVGINASLSGHPFQAKDPNNICNRGESKAGVQIEMTKAFRQSVQKLQLVECIRNVLAHT